MVVANCKQCNRIFQRTISSMCPTCHQQALTKISRVYRFVQNHPNLLLEDIAAQCEISVKEIEAMLLEGKLGTATSRVKYQCQRCGAIIATVQRRGRFCLSCAGRIEHEAGLDFVEERQNETRAKDEPGTPDKQPLHLGLEPKVAVEAAGAYEEPAEPLDSHGFKRISS